jgi:hypothetical protein
MDSVFYRLSRFIIFDLAPGKMFCPEKVAHQFVYQRIFDSGLIWWNERSREPKGRDIPPGRPPRTARRAVPTHEFFRVFRLFRG